MQQKFSKYFALAFVVIAVFNFILLLFSNFLNELFNPSFGIQLLYFIVVSIAMGAFVVFALTIISPLWYDSIVTLRRMLRIENLSNPLLMKLSSEAPGTYHHSLNVGALAQKAAKAIGANSLLVRTAAYYHDIGKMENPSAYVENQAGIDIPTTEDADSIRKNAEVIISHAKKGVEIAVENNLPEDVIDLIKEHHGTTRALYFFQKAKEHKLKIRKTDFRYPGPIPQTKESAILMLADCIEATARALPELTTDTLKSLVKTTIAEKIEDKQLKTANLTEKEMASLQKALSDTLISIYHQRIEYKDGQFDSAKQN